VAVVGLGAQDDLDAARRFVADTGTTTPLMTWDAGAESWRHYGVTRQPATVLLDGTGVEIATWRGSFPAGEVLDRLAG
jgi:hypothetical protein